MAIQSLLHTLIQTEILNCYLFSFEIEITKKGISGSLPRHLVDILAGIFYIYNKEYPQLTNSILNMILIKNEFQPFSAAIAAASNSLNGGGNSSTNQTNSMLSKEQKMAFIESMKRYFFSLLINHS